MLKIDFRVSNPAGLALNLKIWYNIQEFLDYDSH